MADVLEHPLFLLLAGAALTGFLLPYITRRWQDRQKELELKTKLAEEATDAVVRMVTAVQYAELGAQSQTEADYDAAYRDWELARARIAARITGYFPDTDLGRRWHKLGAVVTAGYALSGTSRAAPRAERIAELRRGLPGAELDWDVLADLGRKAGAGAESLREREEVVQAWRREWFRLRDAILEELGRFTEALLAACSAWLRPARRQQRTDPAAVGTRTPAIPSEATVRYDVFGALAPPDLDAVDESDPESLRRYAVAWFNFGRPDRAIEPFDRAVALAPDDARLRVQRSMALGELGRHDDAVADARRATELEPGRDGRWLRLGEACSAAGHPSDALAALDRAIELAPDYTPHWLARAAALDALGRTDEADAAYERAGSTRESAD